jgi:hypothetical protein
VLWAFGFRSNYSEQPSRRANKEFVWRGVVMQAAPHEFLTRCVV